ncbi:hypothetical protein AUJ14_05015 [Candidatus Micrarchaeota archaeon CG1_02_55_22]|nr:MAG: hypothetical protein AUJ14_05015 [Candidatus Micrarchaeota archaeon CG1_02_55_22]
MPQQMSLHEHLLAARDSPETHLESFAERVRERARRVALKMGVPVEDALDIAQLVSLAAISSLHNY